MSGDSRRGREEMLPCISGLSLTVSRHALIQKKGIFEVKAGIKMNETVKRQMSGKMCHTEELTICLNPINLKLIPVID